MKKFALIFCLQVLAQSLFSQQTEFSELTGPYLGQKPPGMTPEAQVIWRGRTNHHGPDWNSAP
jgi:hypothetical protein